MLPWVYIIPPILKWASAGLVVPDKLTGKKGRESARRHEPVLATR